MDNLQAAVTKLGSGLDLTTAKTMVDGGSLVDCLNYEIIDLSGYRRIDGLHRFDGRTDPDQTAWFELTDASFAGNMTTTFPVGSYIGLNATNPFGIVTAVNTTTKTVKYIRIDPDIILGSTVLPIYVLGTGVTTFEVEHVPVEGTTVAGRDAETSVDSLNTYNTTLRSAIKSLIRQPVGLHWFRDKLYAFTDNLKFSFTNGGTQEIYPNDTIRVNTTPAQQFQVVKVTLDPDTPGSWGAGTAAGTLDLIPLGVWTEGAIASTDIDILRPNATTITDVADITYTVGTTGSTTSVWRSRSELQAIEESDTYADGGWKNIDTGWLVEYENMEISLGTLPVIDRRTGLVDEAFDDGASPVSFSPDKKGAFNQAAYPVVFTGDASPGVSTAVAYYESSVLGTTDITKYPLAVVQDDAHYISIQASVSEGETKTTPRLGLFDPDSVNEVPSVATITGATLSIEDLIVGAETTATIYFHLYDVDTGEKIGEPRILELENLTASPLAAADYTIGSSEELWGEKFVDLVKVRSGKIGVAISGEITNNKTPSGVFVPATKSVTIDRLRISFAYVAGFTKYYFKAPAGSTYVEADLLAYRQTDGDLTNGTSTGILQVANLSHVGAGTLKSILPGDEIHLKTDGTAKIGDVKAAAPMVRNCPATLAQLLENDSRYLFITANFYGNEEFDSVFGVTGASRAFAFDGTYYTTIYTQDDDEKDMPRHVEFYHYHLALGYSSGSVLTSVPGEPENFSGLEGAAEVAIGDKITGLLTLRGTMLGVFCENSIWGITGTIADNFSTTILAPKTGAIEYTVLDIGIPVYCDNRGISTLAQSDKYGDFMGTRLSAAVTPWIVPRSIKNKSLLSIANGAGVVCAIPVRSKNQYRLFFRDGFVLSMTMNNVDSAPTFTFQKYVLDASEYSDLDGFIVPLAWSSQVGDDGREHIHISHYSPFSSISTARSYYVYKFDSGWSFDGNFIPAYFTTNWNWLENPFEDNTMRKVRIDGLSNGYSNIQLYTSKDYGTSFTSSPQRVALPKATSGSDNFHQDLRAYTSICNPAERGRTVSLKFENYIPSEKSITSPEPSHICQVLLTQFTGGKQDV